MPLLNAFSSWTSSFYGLLEAYVSLTLGGLALSIKRTVERCWGLIADSRERDREIRRLIVWEPIFLWDVEWGMIHVKARYLVVKLLARRTCTCKYDVCPWVSLVLLQLCWRRFCYSLVWCLPCFVLMLLFVPVRESTLSTSGWGEGNLPFQLFGKLNLVFY